MFYLLNLFELRHAHRLVFNFHLVFSSLMNQTHDMTALAERSAPNRLAGLTLWRTRCLLALVGGTVLLLTTLDFASGFGSAAGFSPLGVLAIFLAALSCEFMDSSLGMGYGTTLTPLLMLAGFAPLEIVPAVLFSELLTGVFAVTMHQRDGNIDFFNDAQARKTAALLASLSSIGAVLAVGVALSLSRFWQSLFISLIILAMGVVILLTRTRRIPYRRSGIMAVGAIAAFNKSLSGGGYGPLVTAGQVVSGVPAKPAVAITSLAESFTCLIGILAYLGAGKPIAWELALPLALGALFSVPLATLTVQRTAEARLRGAVGAVSVVLGVAALSKLIS